MYRYRALSPEERAKLVQERHARGFPPHAPPHTVRDRSCYLLTASCYEHASYMQSANRREQLLDDLFETLGTNGGDIHAWVILPNHYHLVVEVEDFRAVSDGLGLVHGRTSYAWNLADAATGRKVWYRFADRAIRSERHYYTTLNYLHYNAIKHRWAKTPYDWQHSSVHWYLENFGREWLRDLWTKYPVANYGRGWDDFASVENDA